jgi:SAM-dependent methyltransferase
LDRTAAELKDVPIQTALVDINAIEDSALGPFDVILATNCLHVAKDVHGSLAALRSLLAPGGVLVIGEGSHYSDAVPSPLCLVLALFDGWWDAPRSAWRPQPGFLSSRQWLEAFATTGYDHSSAETWADERRAFGGVYWGFAGKASLANFDSTPTRRYARSNSMKRMPRRPGAITPC